MEVASDAARYSHAAVPPLCISSHYLTDCVGMSSTQRKKSDIRRQAFLPILLTVLSQTLLRLAVNT
jgi:hypothetical protein